MLSHREANGMAGASIAIAAVLYAIMLVILGIFMAAVIKVIDLIAPGAPLRAVPKFRAAAKVFLGIGAFLWVTLMLVKSVDPSGYYDWLLYTAAGVSAVMLLYAYRRPFARKVVFRFLAPVWTLTAVTWAFWEVFPVGGETLWLSLMSQVALLPHNAVALVTQQFSVIGFEDTNAIPFAGETPFSAGLPSFLLWGGLAGLCWFISAFTESMGHKGWLTNPEADEKAEQVA